MTASTLCESLGIRLHSPDAELSRLVIPGLRRNPRRAHLLVSTVLGKHIPAVPSAVRGSADRLADLVRAQIVGSPVVFGFAETATGLGHCVAARLDAAVYLHSTRRCGAPVFGRFTEGHSHATDHQLQPSSPDLLAASDTLVLVDDEISTGATALDAIRAFHELNPYRHYVVASLVDLRSGAHRAESDRRATAMGVPVTFVSLAQGTAEVPARLATRISSLPADRLRPSGPYQSGLNPPGINPSGRKTGSVQTMRALWPAELPDGGRHGVLRHEHGPVKDAAARIAAQVEPVLGTAPTIVVGHEELMYLPLCVAEALHDRGHPVRFQTTTRSPALVVDEPGYPLRRGFEFAAPVPDPAPVRYLYNATVDGWPDTRIVLVVDSPADTARLREGGGLLDVLTAAGHDVLLVIVPASDPAVLRDARSRSGE